MRVAPTPVEGAPPKRATLSNEYIFKTSMGKAWDFGPQSRHSPSSRLIKTNPCLNKSAKARAAPIVGSTSPRLFTAPMQSTVA